RAAVRRDDPAARLSPRLFPPGHHSFQSSGPYPPCHCGRTRGRASSCGLWRAKMERVSEVLQLPVIVERRRPPALELQALEKLDFRRGRRAAERGILKEFLEPRLFGDGLFGFPLDIDRKSTRLNSSHVSISYAVFCLKKKKKKHQNEPPYSKLHN